MTAYGLADVRPLLAEVEARSAAGEVAAGFVSFDAAPAFDSAFEVLSTADAPLAEFQFFSKPAKFYNELVVNSEIAPLTWVLDTDRAEYGSAIRQIKNLLRDGVTYQVNFTFRLAAEGNVDPRFLFSTLVAEFPPPYASLYLSDTVTLMSLSPELFFETSGSRVRCRPMKGTSTRGDHLATSEKDRAENVMVVDMIRNDLGRIAKTGTVKTTSLFDVEAYPTLDQMTSTVEAEVSTDLDGIFGALFPCASIVGAPKVSTLKQIRALEKTPRGVYTGAIGVADAAGARFAVAIRTVEVSSTRNTCRYGVGSGVVWDSIAEDEWDECLLKTRALEARSAPFALLETLKWTPKEGFWLLDRHLNRLASSAKELAWQVDPEQIKNALSCNSDAWEQPMRVRLLVFSDQTATVSAMPLGSTASVITARFSQTPVLSGDPALKMKTNRRAFYEKHVREAVADEALLWNERGEATEFCNGNLVVRIGVEDFTPPIECGLLPGTFRQELLDSQRLRERVLSVEDVVSADALFRINSVRGWQEVWLLAADRATSEGPALRASSRSRD